MQELMIFGMVVPVVFFIECCLEQWHYRSLRKREARFARLLISDIKQPLHPERIASSRFVSGSMVISVDYFKRLAAFYRMGNISMYETLIDRARREAILRMKESAGEADEIVNLRIETGSILPNADWKTIGSIEVFAYATALTYQRAS